MRFLSVEVEYKDEIEHILAEKAFKKERKRALVGMVVSTKCRKSVTVQVIHDKYISKYNKFVKVQKKIMAHDEDMVGRWGDIVRIVPCRPMSRRKRHSLKDVIKRLAKAQPGFERLGNPPKEVKAAKEEPAPWTQEQRDEFTASERYAKLVRAKEAKKAKRPPTRLREPAVGGQGFGFPGLPKTVDESASNSSAEEEDTKSEQ